MVKIGLIDDNHYEIDDIQTAIFSSWKQLPEVTEDVCFKCYTLEATPDFKTKLEAELLHDIDSQEIQSLIVDYKLDSLRKVLEGKNVVTYLTEKVPAFPVVILTNAPDGSQRESAIDPDKVYDKHEFLKVGSSESTEMSLKIYLNAKRYIRHRTELEARLSVALNELMSQPDADIDIELIARITEIEDDLANYTTIDTSTAEKAFDLSELRSLILDLSKLEQDIKDM